MPKQKKAPKNAYYFFIMDKKKEYERSGTRFNGVRDLFAMENLREEWKALDAQERAKYDHLAKEAKAADKLDLTNKFTCAGESYAQVQDRQTQSKMEEKLLEEILAIATAEGPGLNSRFFVIFKSIHMAEVGYPPNMEYLPGELAIAAFKLDTGYVISWWTLVDLATLPLGYASAAKDTYDMTRLPLPGSHKYQPKHRDYFNILRNFKNFVEKYVEPVNGYYIVFVKPEDRKEVDQGVLNWLLKNIKFENQEMASEYEYFVKSVKLIRVTQLLLKLAGVARQRTPSYHSMVAIYGFLEPAAGAVLSASDWDYKPNITCAFHNMEEECCKSHVCCRNIVLRTIFLILREIVRPMRIEPTSTHYITCIKQSDMYEHRPAQLPLPPKGEPEEFSVALDKDWGGKSDIAEYYGVDYIPPALAAAAFGYDTGVGGSTAFASGASRGATLNPSSFTTDDFPALGTSSGGVGRGMGRGSSGVSRGATLNPSSFTTDDFPALGTSSGGVGRGMGRGSSGASGGFPPGNARGGGGGFANGNVNGGGGMGMGRGRGGGESFGAAGNSASGGWGFEDPIP